MSEWVSVKEAAMRHATSTRTVWRWIHDFNLDTGKDPGNPATLVNLADLARAKQGSVKGNPAHVVNSG